MPNWNDLLDELKEVGSAFDVIRRKYLNQLHEMTGRNIIAYYSGWLEKQSLPQHLTIGFEINDSDKNGFMTCIHKLDRSKGLDLLLHTPGGNMAATESLVSYLRSMFGTDIRAIVPQIAMSGGTMIACACKEIIMGKQSSLGPIDPQTFGLPAQGIVDDFDKAHAEIQGNPHMGQFWAPILQKYHAGMYQECKNAIEWAKQMVRQWLTECMFKDDSERDQKVERVLSEFGDQALTLSHHRHLSIDMARDAQLNVTALEDNDEFQDTVLTVHYACVHTMASTPAIKIIENHLGKAFIQSLPTVSQTP
jgi:ATP-dependent protease ClpP protease subunit